MAVIEITQAEYDKKFGTGSTAKANEPVSISRDDYMAKFGTAPDGGRIYDEDNEASSNANKPQRFDHLAALGITNEIEPRNEVYGSPSFSRAKQINRAVGEGMVDSTLAVGAGAQDATAQLIRFADDLIGDGENVVADWLEKGSDKFRKKYMYNPGGVADTQGSVGGEMAVAAPVGGKAVDVLLGSGKAVGNAIKRQVGRKSQQAIDDQVTRSNRVSDRIKSGKGTKETDELNAELNAFQKGFERNTKTPKSPQLGIISETIGKLSPTAEKIIDKYYSKILSPVSRRAATENRFGFIKEMMENGYSNKQAVQAWDKLIVNAPSTGSTLKDALFKSPNKAGSAIGILLGQQNNTGDNK